MDFNSTDADDITGWEIEVEYFCDRICPKLKELDEFCDRKDIDLSNLRGQQHAILEVLECEDEINKSPGFQEFYNGLLHFSDLGESFSWGRSFAVGLLFELHGGDPRSFPKTVSYEPNLPSLLSGTSKAKPFLEDLAVKCMTRLEANHSGEFYYDYIREKLHSIIRLARGELEPRIHEYPHVPMVVGFRSLCRIAKYRSLEKAKNYCEKRAKQLVQDRVPNHERNRPKFSGIQIVIGPSGCGKTHYIHSLLQHHWDLYLLAGNFPQRNCTEQSRKSDSLSDELAYRPHRSGASRDTQTWFADVKSAWRCANINAWRVGNVRMNVLVNTRLEILYMMLEAFNMLKVEFNPADWLKLQTSAGGSDDVFNQLFRVARFHKRELTPKVEEKFSRKIPYHILICIDEAQCDLQESVGKPESTPLLSYMMVQIKQSLRHRDKAFRAGNIFPMAISGTALQVDRAIEAIREHQAELILPFRPNTVRLQKIRKAVEDLKISFKESFPIIRGDKDFEKLLREQKWMNGSIQDSIVKEIKENAIPLRGRYNWSVCYLEEIRKLYNTGKLSSEAIQKSCELVVFKAKEGLKDRLRDIEGRAFDEALIQFKQFCSKLKDVGPEVPGKEEEEMRKIFQRQQRLHNKLIDELCWLAIRSDLSGQSTVFESEKSAKMVEQGFAFVEERGSTDQDKTTVVVLKERLAVQAAIEYFQEKPSGEEQGSISKYDQELNKLFYMGQDNQSATGKTAELLFARFEKHLRKVLGHQVQSDDIFSASFLREIRTKLLPILIGRGENVGQLVEKDVSQRFDQRFNCDPDNLCLIEGSYTAYQEETRGDRPDTKTMWNWMRMLREGKDLEYTFWFPSTRAGPDVLFAFRGSTKGLEMNEDILILCAVQIKRQQNPDISDAIQSTNPNCWFCNGFQSDRVGILTELQKWQERGYPIIRILITALTDPPQDDSRKKAYLLKEQNMEKDEEQTMAKEEQDAEKTGKEQKSFTDQKKERSNLTRRRHVELLKAAERSGDESKKRKRKGKTTPMPHTAAERLEQAKRLQIVKIDPDSQYFNWVGAEHDAILFGGAFQRLRESQRRQKEQQCLI